MNSIFYQERQLATILEALQSKQLSGILYIDAEIAPQKKKRSRVLVIQKGQIVYGDVILPTNKEIAQTLGKKLNREWSESAIALATQKAANKTSIRALLDLLIKMRLFTWEQVEAFIHAQVVLILEQILPHAGRYRLDAFEFDLCHGEDGHGLDLSKLMADVNRRQQQLSTFAPTLPSIEAILRFDPSSADKITNPAVRKHLEQWVNGERSLVDIAEALNKDVLQVAQSYLPWLQAGWVLIGNNNVSITPKKELPIILAVDDSPIIQVAIKRALSQQYQVLIASNAKDALMLLHRTDVELLLLDVTMPEIDGLEVCRTVRSILKFRDLPIIMVTAKDGFFDKVKGKFAGATDYVTKPFNPEQLSQLVTKYITDKQEIHANTV